MDGQCQLFFGQCDQQLTICDRYLWPKAGSDLTGSELQKIVGSGNDQNYIFQTDYTDDMVEDDAGTGLRAAIQDRLNLYSNYDYYTDSGMCWCLLRPAITRAAAMSMRPMRR